jgi:glycosyltransferase involved in cell wall biosynthesis
VNWVRILFLSAWLPYPPINGAKIRIYNLIRQLSRSHQITLLAFSQTIPMTKAQESIVELKQFCLDVRVMPLRRFDPKSSSILRSVLSILPRSIAQTYSVEMEQLIAQTMKNRSFDVVIASEVSAPGLVSLLASRLSGVPKVLDALEISLAKDAYHKAANLPQRMRSGLTWFKLRQFSTAILKKTSACTVPSEQERENFRGIVPSDFPVEVVPHSLDMHHYQSVHARPVPNTMVFTGSFAYAANLDAVRFFLGEIYPAVYRIKPEGKLKVLGSLHGVDPGTLPEGGFVEFMGLLEDVRAEVANSWLSVVPLRIGAGTRLKIIESMALGTPVVSTSKGAEGLQVNPGDNILIADTPEEFSAAVLSVLGSPELRRRLSKAGFQLVREKYSAEAMGRSFNSLLSRLVH